MIDLVKTHLTHPWGPPWTLETLGDPWRPLATLGDMLENDQFPPNPETETWSTLKTQLKQKRISFGLVAADKSLVCPEQ